MRPAAEGPTIGFVTTSGGTVDLLFDYMESENAALAAFSDATKAALLPLMQEGIAPKNPLDVGIPSTNEAAAELVPDRARRSRRRHASASRRRAAQEAGYGDMAPFAELMARDDEADPRRSGA